ncbi:unnamed protein product [Microthlaspi erraticum]|uniref:Uncharacterized protein n=1 Tax=Microthlaspi erraticum TaxID=1685480 RepID=A0A6D2JH59_9BRAS|nr:unnamed protein product [Microthlaspi erraticum]
MLQEYLRNQEESTKKMERRIDFIHESLGNKSEVLFKQVIKLDEDIKKIISCQLQEREESNTQPPSLLLQCHHKKKHYQVHEDNEEEEREYEEQLNDEDEEQSIDINASPKQSKDTPSPRPSFLTNTKKSSFYTSKIGSNAKTITTY